LTSSGPSGYGEPNWPMFLTGSYPASEAMNDGGFMTTMRKSTRTKRLSGEICEKSKILRTKIGLKECI